MNYNYIKCLTLLFTCLTINMYAQNIQTIISKTKANPEWQFSNLQFEATTGNGVLVAIDDATTFQEFKGMGVSFDRSAMANFISMSDTERDKVLRGLFDQGKEDGIKLDWIRYPFGTSDFTGTEWYTYNDLPLGDTDPDMSEFSIQKDIDYGFVDLVKEVIAINPNIKILASVWSPPAWMKTNNKLTNGGDLKTQYQQAYAIYLRKAIQAFVSQGIAIDAMTIQNEPEVNQVYPSCRMSIANIIAVQKLLKDEFDTHNINTQIFAGDTQWSKKDDFTVPQTDSAIADNNQYLAGAAWHFYGGGPSAMTNYYNAYPEKLNMMSEVQLDLSNCSFNRFYRISQYFHNYCHVVIDWVTFLDDEGEPLNEGNPFKPVRTGKFVTADKDNLDDWEYDRLYYHYGMISRWVEEGAVRIQTPLNKNNLYIVGFKNIDGTIVLTVANNNCKTLADKYTFTWQGKSFSFDTPADPFIATFIWDSNELKTPIAQINQSTDDAEQKSDNSVDLSSGDLDLGVRPINGLRFSNVNIPQGATITKAYVQFTADKDNQSAAASYTIKGEDVDNASVFTNANGNLSGRSFTSANVNWNNIPAWNTAGESTDAQKTPDLTSILQEIVDKQGWSSGNSLSLFVTGSSGKRSAITYDNDSQKAAKLFVEFELANNYQVSQSSDDAEEATSSMDLNSGDLDFGDKEYNGIRFQNVAIEQGASITNAYIQFTADDNNQSASASYTIYGEDVDNAANFTTANNNLSSRTYTSASVAWNNIPAWNTAGQSGDAQKTPDISSIVQEIVDRGGWSSGNPMAFFVNGNSGKRSARTYDADPNKAAKLVIEYTTGGRRLNSEETVEEKLMVSEAILPAIYPNPANDYFTIMLPEETTDVSITDIRGKIIKTWNGAGKTTVSTVNMNPGIYFVQVKNSIYKLLVSK